MTITGNSDLILTCVTQKEGWRAMGKKPITAKTLGEKTS
jgi:hypothetical protein